MCPPASLWPLTDGTTVVAERHNLLATACYRYWVAGCGKVAAPTATLVAAGGWP